MFTGWRTCLEPSPPRLSPRQRWWRSLPHLPTQLRLLLFLVDLIFLSDASADHFSLIFASVTAVLGGLSPPPQVSPPPSRQPGVLPAPPWGRPLSLLRRRAWGGGRRRMGRSTRNVFNSKGNDICSCGPSHPGFVYPDRGPLLVLRGRFCQVWWDRQGGGVPSLPGWSGHPEPSPHSEAEEGSVVSWKDQNSDDHF